MKHLLLILLLAAPSWAQAVVGAVITSTKLPTFWVIQSYGSMPKPGDILELKRDGWPAGKAKATKVEGRLVLVRVIEGKLDVGDVAVPTGKNEMLTPLDAVGSIPPGVEVPQQQVEAYVRKPQQKSHVASMGGGKAPATRASTVKRVVVNTAPHGVHDLDFERRTGQKPFAADSKGVPLKTGETLNLGTYMDVEANPLTAYWVNGEKDRSLALKVDGRVAILDKQGWYRFKAALEDSVDRRQGCAKGAPPVVIARIPGTNGVELQVMVISSEASDYGWTAIGAGGKVCKFTDRGNDNLGGLQRLFTEVGMFWKTE